jgi:hypothetical protein
MVDTLSLSSGAHSRDPLALPTHKIPSRSMQAEDAVDRAEFGGLDQLGVRHRDGE